MKKKFVCTVCGYVHEGETAPEKCPLCKAPAAKFKEMDDAANADFATKHVLGAARNEDVSEVMMKGLDSHFNCLCC